MMHASRHGGLQSLTVHHVCKRMVLNAFLFHDCMQQTSTAPELTIYSPSAFPKHLQEQENCQLFGSM